MHLARVHIIVPVTQRSNHAMNPKRYCEDCENKYDRN